MSSNLAPFLTDLIGVIKAIHETGDAEQIQRLLVEKTYSTIGAEGAALILTNESSKPRISAVSGSFPAAAFENQYTVKDLGAKGVVSVLDRSGRSCIEAKVGALGNEIGTLVAWWKDGRERPEGTSLVMGAIADQAAIAICNAANLKRRRQSEERFRNMIEEVNQLPTLTNKQTLAL